MGLFHKNKQKEAVQEVKQPQISLEDKAYPIIYTANYISERFENLSDEEVVVSNQIVGPVICTDSEFRKYIFGNTECIGEFQQCA